MKFQQLVEMPQLTKRELGDDPSDDHQPMTVFFMTNEAFDKRYEVVGETGPTVAGLARDLGGALIGVRGIRHADQVPGIHIFGELHFKLNPNLGTPADPLQLKQQRVLQVSLVNVVKDTQFRGVGSFFYSSIVQAGFTIVSDSHHFTGGKALWQKLGRTHRPNEAVYVMNRGQVMLDDQGQPLQYNGSNIPEDTLWSEDAANKYVLFIYKRI